MSVIVHTFIKNVYPLPADQSWSNFMCNNVEGAVGVGKGTESIKFWDRLIQNCGYHGNEKLPKTNNG